MKQVDLSDRLAESSALSESEGPACVLHCTAFLLLLATTDPCQVLMFLLSEILGGDRLWTEWSGNKQKAYP